MVIKDRNDWLLNWMVYRNKSDWMVIGQTESIKYSAPSSGSSHSSHFVTIDHWLIDQWAGHDDDIMNFVFVWVCDHFFDDCHACYIFWAMIFLLFKKNCAEIIENTKKLKTLLQFLFRAYAMMKMNSFSPAILKRSRQSDVELAHIGKSQQQQCYEVQDHHSFSKLSPFLSNSNHQTTIDTNSATESVCSSSASSVVSPITNTSNNSYKSRLRSSGGSSNSPPAFTVSEGSNHKNLSVILANIELWNKFDANTNEMVVTRPGR